MSQGEPREAAFAEAFDLQPRLFGIRVRRKVAPTDEPRGASRIYVTRDHDACIGGKIQMPFFPTAVRSSIYSSDALTRAMCRAYAIQRFVPEE